MNAKPGKQTLTRRQWLQTAAAVALPAFIPSRVFGSPGDPAPSNRITVALIGNGCMGRGHLRRLIGDRDFQVLAVCDPDKIRRDEGLQAVEAACAADRDKPGYRACTPYNDYRELLARTDLDAVVIATPDHWHTLQSVDAVKAGKDVYCEKPISLTVDEGRRLVQAVHRYGRIFQTGTQYRSIPAIRQVCQFVRDGGLGKIKQVFTLWNTLGGFIAGPRFAPYAAVMDVAKNGASPVPMSFDMPAEPTPDGLDWDLWTGPAPARPYNPVYHINPIPGVVPWSFHEDFGAASVTWHHSHSADVIQYALGCETSGPVEFIHPADGKYPTLTCRYENGTLLHLVEHWGQVKDLYHAVPADARLEGNFGGLFVGERGWLTSMSTGGPVTGGPEEVFNEMKMSDRAVNIGQNDHHANWLNCIKTRQQPSCPEELGHRSASLGHLTIIAYKQAKSLSWDPAKETFPTDDAANRLLARPKRSPWTL
jgi:hypothetical protein